MGVLDAIALAAQSRLGLARLGLGAGVVGGDQRGGYIIPRSNEGNARDAAFYRGDGPRDDARVRAFAHHDVRRPCRCAIF